MADIKSHASLPTSLVSYWDLQEASGTRYDLVGANNLTDNNTVLQGTGKVGKCADFESTNSEYLSITDASQSGLDITGDFSFSCWVYFETDPDTSLATLFSKYTGTTDRSYLCDVGDGTTIRLVWFDAAGSSYAKSVTWNPTTATWYHIVVTYTASAGAVRFYLDGSQLGTTQTGGGTNIRNGAAKFALGERDGGSYLDGLMDEVGIWNKVLSDQEVTDLYNSGNGLAYFAPADVKNNTTLTTSLVSYWEMEETSGTRTDSHSTNDLTDNNTVLSATGILGNGADFELATTEWLSVADNASLSIVGSLSVSGWIKLETVGITAVIAGKYSSSAARSWLFYVDTSNRLQVTINQAADGSDQSVSLTTNTLSVSTWYHVAFSYNSATGVVKIFIDGVEAAYTTQTSNATAINDNAADLTIGRNEASFYFDGVIDELAIWSKAIVVSEVRALYGYGTPPNYEDVTSTVNSGFFGLM